MGLSNLQGVVISNVFRGQDAPRFIPAFSVGIGYIVLAGIFGSVLHHLLLRRENAKRRSGARDHLLDGKTDAEIKLMGDIR